jgi:hypothetical protein
MSPAATETVWVVSEQLAVLPSRVFGWVRLQVIAVAVSFWYSVTVWTSLVLLKACTTREDRNKPLTVQANGDT